MRPPWVEQLHQYEKPRTGRSLYQLGTTFLPYFILLGIMHLILSRGFSVWWILPPAGLAAALLVRIFIIFHDCVHQSYFSSRRLCSFLGSVVGVLVFTSYHDWRRSHLIHHASVSNLDKRGIGDVWTMTVREYKAASRMKRLLYRAYRSPFVLFGLGSPFLFLIWNRLPVKGAGRKEKLGVLFTDIALIAIVTAAALTIGIREYLLIQLPVITMAGISGTWLFFVQHQYEGVRWWRTGDWKSFPASMEGSSYYKLPAVLRWFSGNIGYHHIHHLSPRIPNYNLRPCYNEIPELREILAVTMVSALRAMFLELWDEEGERLISFRAAENLGREREGRLSKE